MKHFVFFMYFCSQLKITPYNPNPEKRYLGSIFQFLTTKEIIMATPAQALKQIQDYANINSGTAPTLSTYSDAGIKDANGKLLVTSMNLAAINSALAYRPIFQRRRFRRSWIVATGHPRLDGVISPY